MRIQRVPERIKEIAKAFQEAGGAIHIVGGWVRDMVIREVHSGWDIEPKDTDIVVSGVTIPQAISIIERFGRIIIDDAVPQMVVIVAMIDGEVTEFAMARKEIGDGQGKWDVEFQIGPDVTIFQDSFRRDIRIGAMFCDPISGEVIDFHDGIQDIKDQVIRPVGESFKESAERVVRVMAFASRFGFDVDESIIAFAKDMDWTAVPAEQHWRQGFWKWASKAKDPSKGWMFMMDCGWSEAFPQIFGPQIFGWKAFKVFRAIQDRDFSEFQDGQERAVAVFAAVRDVVGDESMAQFFEDVRAPKAFAREVWQVGKPDRTAFRRDVGRAVMAAHSDRSPGPWISQAVEAAWDAVMKEEIKVADASGFAVDSVE